MVCGIMRKFKCKELLSLSVFRTKEYRIHFFTSYQEVPILRTTIFPVNNVTIVVK